MKTKQLKPKKYGVYIFNEGNFYTSEEWGEKAADGVLLYTKHASLVIDIKEMGEMTWNDAMTSVKKVNKKLPDRFEALEITDHRNELNEVLRQIGGQEISGWYWTGSEYSAALAWGYNSNGGMSSIFKYLSYNVRAVTRF
jgi:hypothetical protein